MNLPKDTIVELVANKSFGWSSAYQALDRGERRFFKVIRSIAGYTDPWGYKIPNKYLCKYVDLATDKRKGSWDYSFFEGEVIPVVRGPINLQNWM